MSQPDPAIHARFLLRRAPTAQQEFCLDVDITLPGGGITAIFGPSGSGKTSFLRCVAGLEKPQQGYLHVNGETWQSESTFTPTHRRPLGYVFQESSLFPNMSARANLTYALTRARKPVPEGFFDQVIQIMNLAACLPRRPARLSAGERQRVAIARALLIQPRLLLMDEPLASLDARRKQEILPYLERLRSRFDMPIFYVSHSMDEVARLADHAVVLDSGRVLAQGNLTEVFSRIDSPLNSDDEASAVLSGQVTQRDVAWHLCRIKLAGGAELWVRDSGDAVAQPVRVRVLARDISLALECHEDSSILNRLGVEVAAIAPDRDEAMSLVRLRAGSDFFLARITRRSVDHLQLAPGKRVWAQVKSAAIVR